jgi:hypothetical protein
MKIQVNIGALGRSKWYEDLVRFAFGGAVTALAGIIAKRWGPEIGGLFLAFPAIFPATATLIEKHERQKKERTGQNGTLRARAAAGLDAAGAAMGCTGLLAFAFVVWRWLPDHSVAVILSVATLAWLMASVLTWIIHENILRRLERKLFGAPRHSGGIIVQRKSSGHRSSDE